MKARDWSGVSLVGGFGLWIFGFLSFAPGLIQIAKVAMVLRAWRADFWLLLSGLIYARRRLR